MKKRVRISARNTSYSPEDFKNSIKKETFDFFDEDHEYTSQSMEEIWMSLPTDFNSSERMVFLEIAEKIIKLQKKRAVLDDEITISDKN